MAEWVLIAGVGYRKIAPNTLWTEDNDEVPFKLATLDPRYTYIVRYNDIYQEPICAVTYTINSDLARTYYVYTKDKIVSKAKNSPFIDRQLKVKVKYTIVRGDIVYTDVR